MDNPEDVAQLIQQVDPEQRCAVIWIAAPPCQDFTPVRDAPPGHSGSRGSLFLQSDNFWKAIAEKLGSRPTGWMYENVVMAHEHAARVSERLGVQPVMSCASDFGWISRPRLWWLHVDWSKWPCDPITNEPLRWGKRFKWNRVRFEGVRKAVADFQLDGLSFHPAVVSGRLKLPCATTPAESDNGRPAPRHSRGKVPEETKQRWLQDCRQLAPWHYAEEAMMTNAAGQLVNIPPIIREQLHDMPPQFTAVPSASDKDRLRMVANGWHWGTAAKLIAILIFATVSRVSAVSAPATNSHELTLAGRRPRQSTLAAVASWTFRRIRMGPRGPDLGDPLVDPQLDAGEHWQATRKLAHPLARQRQLEPGLEAVLELYHILGSELLRIRAEVLEDIEELIFELHDQTEEWMATRPAHVRQTLTTPTKARPTQVPLFLHLLELIGYEDTAGLRSDFEEGFAMLGNIRPGPGWTPRADGRYDSPQHLTELNKQYVSTKAKQGRQSPHNAILLEELVEEARLGRVAGPRRAPSTWNLPFVALPDRPGFQTLLDPPKGQRLAAASFAILQKDEQGRLKVRRGEDWRRSSHNAAVHAGDVPTHHVVDDFVRISLGLMRRGSKPQLFGHDMLNAYRQLPVKEPAHCGTFLSTKHGVTLWFHNAMCFGAAASVWNFNRMADALQQLIRTLFLTPLGHFVDDFNGAEDERTAESGFAAVGKLFDLLGFQTKPSKAQPPHHEQVVQGVILKLSAEGVTVAPTPKRVLAIKDMLSQALVQNLRQRPRSSWQESCSS